MCQHEKCKRVNIRNYRIAYTSALGESEGEVHHIDHDRKNNCLLNLVLLTKDEHQSYHNNYPADIGGISDYLGVSQLDAEALETALSSKLLELNNSAKKAAIDFVNDVIGSDDLMMIVSKSMSQSHWLSYHSNGMIDMIREFSKIKLLVTEKASKQHLAININ